MSETTRLTFEPSEQEPPLFRVIVACLVCGEHLSLPYRGDSATYAAICDECREAVKLVKENMKVFKAMALIQTSSRPGSGEVVNVPLGSRRSPRERTYEHESLADDLCDAG